MTIRLLLDEHYAPEIADRLRADGHDVVAVVAEVDLQGQPDAELFRRAAGEGRRIVTENIKDFRPLLVQAYTTGEPFAQLLFVSRRRFPRGTGTRAETIVKALGAWLNLPDVADRPDEEWLA